MLKIDTLQIARSCKSNGTTCDRRHSGRPREMTLRQDRHITLIHLRNRFVTAVDTARRIPGIRNNIISDQTVRNRLSQSDLRSRHLLKGMGLKRRHRIASMGTCTSSVEAKHLAEHYVF